MKTDTHKSSARSARKARLSRSYGAISSYLSQGYKPFLHTGQSSLSLVAIAILVTLWGCSQSSHQQTKPLNIALVDSVDQSARVVSLQVHQNDGQSFLYAAGEGKTLEAYALNTQGKLTLVERYQLTEKFGGIRALTDITIQGNHFLALGNKAENSLEIHRIHADGRLEKIEAVYDSDSTFIDEIVTIQHVAIKGRNYLYAGGLDRGMSCFEIKEDGTLRYIQSMADDDQIALHGIIGMSTLVVDDKTFLVTGAFFDGGISCFEVQENGTLQNTSNVQDDDQLFLNGAFSVNTVQLGNQHFLLVGHRHNLHYSTEGAAEQYHGDGINVFTVDSQGQLKLQSLLKDDDDLLLKGSTRIEIIKTSQEEALVFIATRDDHGIQICSLSPDGILKPIDQIDLGYGVYNGMTIEQINGQWFLIVGSYKGSKVEVYTLKLK